MESLRPRGLVEYLEIIWRGKLLIFLVAASILIAAFLVIRRIPNVYESRSSIVISKQANEDSMLPGASLAALTQKMTSRGNLAAIIDRYGLYRHLPGQVFDADAAVERLRKEIKLDVKMRNYYPDAPEALTVSYRYTDPSIAQRVVADLVSVFEQANDTMRRQAEIELHRFHDKLSEVESQLQSLAPRRDISFIQAGISARSSGVASEIRAQRLATSNLMESLSDKEFMLERQLDEQKRQMAEQEKLARSAPRVNGFSGGGAYGVLLTRRAEVEGRISDLLTSVTEKNPKLVQARSQLTAINQEISRLDAGSESSADATASSLSPEGRELRAMQREAQRMQTELEVTKRDLGRKSQTLKSLPGIPSTSAGAIPTGASADTRAEYDRVLGRYNWLMDKQETMQKLLRDDGKHVAMFQMIDAPNLSWMSVAPNRMFLLLLAAGIALGMGLLAAAARELPRLRMIHNESDVGYYLGTPVLALIPETLTSYERSRRRRLGGLRWLGLLLLAAVLIPIFFVALDRLHIFQILANK
ncbi:MAG TPA: Wzz/FepE/Etk N-terminal domain-containing protein [Blastocatellia bacterium]|nr:Wzz/FepE/Etk N-terminal domain-containing protein [Blastocatellia bacterium]